MRRWAVLRILGVFSLALLAKAAHGEVHLTYQFEREWPLLPQPWCFANPYGVAVGPDGTVYVADTQNGRIQRFDATGVFLGKWGSPGAGDGQFSGSTGVAAGPDGTVYVADRNNHRIQRFDATGVFLGTWGSEGAGDGQFYWPRSVAVGPDGTVYVADTQNDRIQRFDATGAFLGKWGSYGAGDGQLYFPYGVAVDGVGNVYVTDCGHDRIQRFDATGAFLGTWGSEGSGEGQFNAPSGVAVGPDDTVVYVVDTQNNRIQRFGATGAFLGTWGSEGSGEGQFNAPSGVAVGPDGTVYVADEYNHRIQRFDATGAFLGAWGPSHGTGEGQFDFPTSVAVGPDSTLYVADAYNDRIQRFSATGVFLGTWGSEGSGEGQFNFPYDVAVAPDGTVYVADALNGRIQRFDATGVFLGAWGSEDNGGALFETPPYCLTLAPNGTVYVVDTENHRIQRFDAMGVFLGAWGSEGIGDGQFNYPRGVAAGPDGTVYVADEYNHRIQRFDPTGAFGGKWGAEGSGYGQFSGPGDVALGPDGTVYVADSGNHRIQRFDATGVFLGTWGSYGTGDGQFVIPSGVAVGSDGTVYVVDKGNHRIQRFEPVVLTERAKAILVAGGGPYPGNSLWPATVASANYAYAAMTSQAFTKETIYYLSSDTDLDLDFNGEADDVDADCTWADLRHALTQWAPEQLGGLPIGDVVVFLVDHGGPDTFRLNDAEVLTAGDLASWLSTLQPQIQGKVMVVVDACYCGSFVDDLSAPDRIVVASASANEEAQFQGAVSFSDYFWTRVFAGGTVLDAFDMAVAGAASQAPVLDDNGNGTGNDGTDGAVAAVTHIGTGTQNTFNAPVITAAVGDHTLTGTATTTLWADATDTDGVGQVWAIIQPPDATSATRYPSQNLWPVGGARWENTAAVFTTAGTYTVLLYARDRLGSTCVPTKLYVTVDNPLRRKALVVAGIAGASSARWPGIEYAADQAYKALAQQSYSSNDIYYLSASGTMGVDGLATWNNVRWAIETWAAMETYDLVVYLVGDGTPGAFVLNATEMVTAMELDGWLDSLQSSLPGGVVLVNDADFSGGFLPALTPPAGKDRIVIASTGASDPMRMLYGGAVSFSTYFWAKVLNGAKVGPAFAHAATAMFYAAGASPSLDDTGDGEYVIKGEDPDGILARQYRIGSGILLADDEPMIGGIVGEQVLVGTSQATIWVSGVTSTATLDRVLATVRPPGMEAVPGDLLPTFELWPEGSDRYEASYAAFTVWGTYNVSVVAMDINSSVSFPAVTTVVRQDGADSYEDDDAQSQASWIGLDAAHPQRHNLHDLGDEDWAVFHATAGEEVTVETENLEANVDTYLALYRAGGTLIAANDDRPLDVSSYLRWIVDTTGSYYIRVTDAGSEYGLGTGYDLKAWRETAPGVPATLILSVYGMGVGVPSATVTVTMASPYVRVVGQTGPLGTSVLPGLDAGTYSVTVSAPGYLPGGPTTEVLSAGQVSSRAMYLVPISAVGSVQVTIEPSGVRAAGARWGVDGGAWQDSGAAVTGVPEGAHTVTFKAVSGWDTPADQSVTVVSGQMTTAVGIYAEAPEVGSLTVTIEPAAAQTAGAQWQVDGGAWHDSGDTVELTVGGYTVSFRGVTGWPAPNNQQVAIANNVTTAISVDYSCMAPSAPPDVQASDGMANGVLVTWTAVTKADVEYQVYRNTTATLAGATSVSGWITDTEFLDDTAAAPTTTGSIGCNGGTTTRYHYYHYCVQARRTEGCVSDISAFDIGHRGEVKTVYEKVFPSERWGDTDTVMAKPDSELAIRVRSDEPIAEVWGLVSWSSGETGAVEWRPVDRDCQEDGWVVYTPQTPWTVGEVITMTVAAETLSGGSLPPVTYQFRVQEDGETGARNAEAATIIHVPVLPDGVGDVYIIEPDAAFTTPERVWLSVPDGVDPAGLGVYYYHMYGADAGWYPAEAVNGWLVPSSYVATTDNGQAYLGFEVWHGGIVQLGRYTPIDSLAASSIPVPGPFHGAVEELVLLGIFLALEVIVFAKRRRTTT